jgi:hypothetical protein
LTLPQSYAQGGNSGNNGYGNNNGCDGNGNNGGNSNNTGNTLNLQVVATSVEPSNGSMASIVKDVTVQLLSGQACATPVGVNPYVSYANSASATQIVQPTTSQIVVATPLVPVSSSYAITLPITANTGSAAASVDDDLDASMESLLERLSQSVGVALWKELSR